MAVHAPDDSPPADTPSELGPNPQQPNFELPEISKPQGSSPAPVQPPGDAQIPASPQNPPAANVEPSRPITPTPPTAAGPVWHAGGSPSGPIIPDHPAAPIPPATAPAEPEPVTAATAATLQVSPEVAAQVAKAGISPLVAQEIQKQYPAAQDIDPDDHAALAPYVVHAATAAYDAVHGVPPTPEEAIDFAKNGPQSVAGPSAIASSILRGASALGVQPRDLAAIIGYESAGSFSPERTNPWGYKGLIQFAPDNWRNGKYGLKPGMSFDQQMDSVISYMQERGIKPGMGLHEMYEAVDGGHVGAHGVDFASHLTPDQTVDQRIGPSWLPRADKLLAGTYTPAPTHYGVTNDTAVPYSHAITPADRAAAQAAQATNGMSLGAAIVTTYQDHNTLSNILQDVHDARQPVDPNFKMDPSTYKADPRTANVDPEYAGYIMAAHNQSDYEDRLARMQQVQADDARVAQSAHPTISGLVAGAIDPSNALFAALPELGAGSKIAQFLVKGAEGAAINTGISAYDQHRRSDYDWQALAGAAALGGAMGAGASLLRGEVHPALQDPVLRQKAAAEAAHTAANEKLKSNNEKAAMEMGSQTATAHYPGKVEADGETLGNMIGSQARMLDPQIFDMHDSLQDTISNLTIRGAQGEEGLEPQIAAARASLDSLTGPLNRAFAAAEKVAYEHYQDSAQGISAGAEAVSKAAQNGREPIREDSGMWLSPEAQEAGDTVRALGGKYLRPDIGGQGRNTPLPLANLLMSKLVGIQEGLVNRGVVGENAFEAARRDHETATADVMRNGEVNFQAWAKAQGRGADARIPFRSRQLRDQFSAQVKQYLETRDPLGRQGFDENVRKAGDHMSEAYGRQADMNNNPGLISGEDLAPLNGATPRDANYTPHMWDRDAFNEMERSQSSTKVKDAIRNAVAKGLDAEGKDLDGALVEKIGNGLYRGLRNMASGQEMEMSRMLSGEDPDGFLGFLRKEVGLSEEQLDQVAGQLKGKSDGLEKEGSVSRLKARTPIDYNHVETFRDGTQISIKDMLSHDAYSEFNQYSRSVSAQRALARVRIDNPLYDRDLHGPGGELEGKQAPLAMDGIRSGGDWDTLKKMLNDQGVQVGMNEAQIKKMVGRLDEVYNHITGHMSEADKGASARTIRTFGSIARSVYLGTTGILHTGQYLHGAAEAGIVATLKNVPELAKMIALGVAGQSRDAEGLLRNENARILEALTGQGSEWIRGKFAQLPLEEGSGSPKGGLGARLEYESAQLGRWSGVASGITPIMTGLQRWFANAAITRFEMDAAGTKMLNARRLAIMGMDRAQADKVGEQFRKYGKDLAKWDPAARHDFATALGRWVAKVANEHDPGQMAAIMGGQMGRLLSQFRTFAVASYTNAILYHANMRDATTAATMAMMTMGGLAAYTGQTMVRTAGMSEEEKDKYLQKMFSKEKLIAGTLHGSGLVSMLPAAADTLWDAAGFKPSDIGGSVRSTGVGSAPVLDYMSNAVKALHGLSQPLHGKPMARSDAQAAINMLPFSHTAPGIYLTNRMVQGMPRSNH